jgi:hypothetical protein
MHWQPHPVRPAQLGATLPIPPPASPARLACIPQVTTPAAARPARWGPMQLPAALPLASPAQRERSL